MSVGVETTGGEGSATRAFTLERMLVELLRNAGTLPLDYYKELIASYRKIADGLDMRESRTAWPCTNGRQPIRHDAERSAVNGSSPSPRCVHRRWARFPKRHGKDVVLSLISASRMADHVTMKGGVVMQQISGDKRRATRDLDHSKYFLLTLVTHGQNDSIGEKIAHYGRALSDADLTNIPFHSELLLNGRRRTG